MFNFMQIDQYQMELGSHGKTYRVPFTKKPHSFICNMNHSEIMPHEVQLPDSDLREIFCMLSEHEM